MSRIRLFAPGPVEISMADYQETLDVSLNHRTPSFSEMMRELNNLLGFAFQTTQPVYIIASSGTGGMECAVVNLFTPGEKVLVIDTGLFGERFTDIALANRLTPIVLKPTVGFGVTPEAVQAELDKDPEITGVLAQFVDTSTGVRNPIKEIAAITRKRNCFFVVDGVSGLVANPYYHDAWGVDVTVSASQKGFEIPPGLSFITLSERAQEKIFNREQIGSYYFNLQTIHKFFNGQNPQTPFTPAISLFKPLLARLRRLKESGLEKTWLHHQQLAKAVRAGIHALGLPIFTNPEFIGDTLTPIALPKGMDGQNIVKRMREESGFVIAGGQGNLQGKIIRLGHIGNIDIFDTLGVLAALELVLLTEGMEFAIGTSVTAAMQDFSQHK